MEYNKLTKTQREVLYALTKIGETPKHIAFRRKTSVRAVYKVLNKLKKKGFISGSTLQGYRGFIKSNMTLDGGVQSKLKEPKSTKYFKQYIRLHRQEFNVRIIAMTDRYKTMIGTSFQIEGNTIRLYKDSIEIYFRKEFEAEDCQRTYALSIQYLEKILRRIENRLNVLLIKQGSMNIKEVYAHYAEVNNELAKEYRLERKKLSIYGKDDGKLWFKFDFSKGQDEAEAVHPQRGKQDMEKFKEVMNDIRENEFIPLSKISEHMANTTKQINEISHGLNALVNFMQSQIPPKEEKLLKERPSYLG